VKRTKLKPMSAKTRQRIADAKEQRAEMRAHHCMFCQKKQATEVHEITAGSGRQSSYGDRRGQLALCKPCHSLLQGWGGPDTIARQYWSKKTHDTIYYDRIWLNHSRGRAENAISDLDVEEAWQWLKKEGYL
jgi:hypothetical protein